MPGHPLLTPVIRRCLAALVLAAGLGSCRDPHVKIKIYDPDDLAGAAVFVAIGTEADRLQEVDLTTSFPATITLVASDTEVRTLWVEARNVTHTALARAVGPVAFDNALSTPLRNVVSSAQ